MDPKALKKLIKVCRELGVQSYEGEGFKFTLTAEAPVKESRHKSRQGVEIVPETNPDFDSDTLTTDQLLFFSVTDTENTYEIGT